MNIGDRVYIIEGLKAVPAQFSRRGNGGLYLLRRRKNNIWERVWRSRRDIYKKKSDALDVIYWEIDSKIRFLHEKLCAVSLQRHIQHEKEKRCSR